MPRQRYDDYAHLNPGLLRHRVTIYSRTLDPGTDDATFTVPFLSDLPAAMNPTGARKFFSADTFNVENLDSCLLRWQDGIEETMQLEYRGQRYEILSTINVNERDVALMLALRRLE